ncbi:MAG: chemotaxis response regulator protein-glutamate methylesterase [Pseudomonadota bacterium]
MTGPATLIDPGTGNYSAANPIRVLVIDDSALMRKLLTELFREIPDVSVVGAAKDPFDARDKIKTLSPDVLTLDVEMPRMDGITFLQNLMRLRPMPVVMVSTLTEKGSDVTLRALALGATGFVPKPTIDVAKSLEDKIGELVWEVRKAAASGDDIRRSRAPAAAPRTAVEKSRPSVGSDRKISGGPSSHIIAIGASTGGTEAIRDVLVGIKPGSPGIVITQHIPIGFSGSFARRMNDCTSVHVVEAEAGMQIRDGHAYIAPGDKHLKIVRDGPGFKCELDDGPRVHLHKPSVDFMFDSVAEVAGAKAVGVILTGMGRDGALGLRRMRDAGACTIGQDESTCIVYGMPRAAIEEQAVQNQYPLDDIAAAVNARFSALPAAKQVAQ